MRRKGDSSEAYDQNYAIFVYDDTSVFLSWHRSLHLRAKAVGYFICSNMILSETINQILELREDEKQTIESAFREQVLTKGELWVKAGKVCEQVAFLVKGKLRVFYGDGEGNEVTCHFVTPQQFISSFTSFLTNTPTIENIAAIEDSTLLVISKKELEVLSDELPKMQIWRRIVAENLFITLEKRVAMLQSQTAHERYEQMLRENPDIILSVPLQYTASFLGITPQHLSRLRKESLK